MVKRSRSNKDAKIKILVACHKPAEIVKSDLLIPIHVGAALSGVDMDIQGDNTGDNISARNRSYCEMTGIYWAWKNLDLDYYGLFHYRRYLSSSEPTANGKHAVTFSNIAAVNEASVFNDGDMRKLVGGYDAIVPMKNSIKDFCDYDSIYDHYENDHNIRDLDYCIDYINKNYEHISPFVGALDDTDGYFCNMFIMKKDIFNEYCEFIFDVLENFEKNNDISNYDQYQYRVSGFLAERLTNVFIQYLQSQDKYKIKEQQTLFIDNTDPKALLTPVKKKDNVAIVLAANNYYVPYISTLLHSIAENASDTFTYDVNIFHHDITKRSMQLLKSEFSEKDNIHIRFYDISDRRDEYQGLFTRGHFALETYFRLFIQDIMLEYEKVLYLDGDMIVNHDVAELYNTDVAGYVLAACIDPDTAGLYNGYQKDKKDYMDNILKIEKPFEYFQAGVILFNLQEMRRRFKVQDLIEFAASYEWQLLDQDVLNYIAQGHIKHVDMAWNVMYDWRGIRLSGIVAKAPIDHYLAYVEARKDPKIIHYAGPEKPWNYPGCDYAEYYWAIARKSVYYELILSRMSQVHALSSDRSYYDRIKFEFKIRPKVSRRIRKVVDIVSPVGTKRRQLVTKSVGLLKRRRL